MIAPTIPEGRVWPDGHWCRDGRVLVGGELVPCRDGAHRVTVEPYRELLRWDGDLITLSSDFLMPPVGPVKLSFDIRSGPVLERGAHSVAMASLPSATELIDLIGRLAATWTFGHRRGIVVRYRLLEELEARREWGDR